MRSVALGAVVLSILPSVLGHGDEESSGHGGMNMTPVEVEYSMSFDLPSYFNHGEYTFWIWSHIATMIISWCLILPVAVMFSIAKSRYTLISQLAFVVINGLGLFTGLVYNTNTPDLYVNNAHHQMGWICSAFAMAWFLIGIVNTYTTKRSTSIFKFSRPSYQQINQNERRWSDDSGVDTAVSPSGEIQHQSFSGDLPELSKEEDDEDDKEGHRIKAIKDTRLDRFLVRNIQKYAIGTPLLVLRIIYSIFERTLLLLGFSLLLTGFVTFAGIFRGTEVFTGLAHFIKGGIFFWLGILMIGRWAGAFADLGWAWNVKPPAEAVGRAKAATPSAEFFESFLIAFYGISNVWLEHLNSDKWNPMDYEHVSITILFFGGGLLGLLVESPWIRKLLNMNILTSQPTETHFSPENTSASPSNPTWSEPRTTRTPMNVVPALTIGLLGIIMGAHVQHSVLASTMHTMWGALFAFSAAARISTYILHYLSPPVSYYPSRPPTEIITGFTLVAGGLLFMMSARDITDVLEGAGGDAMVAFVVGMGFTAVICTLTVASMAVKGWAVKVENTRELAELRGQGANV